MISPRIDQPARGRYSLPKLAARAALILLLIAALAIWGYRLLRPSKQQRLYQSGLEALKANDLGAVQVAIEALSAAHDAEPYVRVLQGAIDLRQGRLSQAVARFLKAREDPRVAAIANMLAGDALYRNRQFGDAIDALAQSVQLDPSLTDAHRRLAAVYYDIGATAPAIREMLVVADQAPDDPRPHRMMGLIYKDQEAFPAAVKAYQEALRRDPNLPERNDVLLELAHCQLKAWQHSGFEQTIKMCPRSADALAMEAEAQFKLGNSTEARQLAEQALRLQSDHLEALLLKGTLELLAGEAKNAVATLDAAAEHHPFDYRIRYKLSQAYSRLGQTEQADQQAEKAKQLREMRARFADLHAQASVDTGNAELRYQLGVLASQLGRSDLAVSWFTDALALDPNLTQASTALQQESQKLLPKTGNAPGARN